ncbi:MAG: transporter substrate-binding domain-containing protein [Spirochaetes bacterium]|nr:transporter substrate-binding domain-containing protein [Spirochaetota bacterium]
MKEQFSINLAKKGLLIIFFGLVCVFSSSLSGQENLSLSQEEKEWLNNHQKITVVQDPGWPPVEFTDEEGRSAGITHDYLTVIESRLGVKFERISGLSWQEAYSRLKKHEIDMTTSVTVTPERLEFWAFTKPYMKIPIVIVTHSDVTYISSLKELEGKDVAVVDGYAMGEWIAKDFPQINLVKVNSAEEGLISLSEGQVFAFIDNMLVTGYYMSKLKLGNLKIAGESPYINAQSMAVRKDWAILARILEKALDSIPEEEKNAIYYKWVPIRYEHKFDYSLLWKIFLGASALCLILLMWIIKLRKEINLRKKTEEALSESEFKLRSHIKNTPTGVIQWDENFHISEFNPAAEKIFGYTEEEVKGRTAGFLMTETSAVHYSDIQKTIAEKKESIYTIIENSRKNGKIVICGWTNTPIVSDDGRLLSTVSLCKDITSAIEDREALAASVNEKETLIRELYHRTKNNMQIISSFIQIQSRKIGDEKVAAFAKNIVSKIQTMSLVHEKLYQSKNLSKINLKEYIEELISLIANYNSAANNNISVVFEIADTELSIDSAIPLGLVINEIITNSFKHAFLPGEKGRITVSLKKEKDGALILIISDDGKGLSEGFDVRETASLGMTTIFSIIEKQMQGSVDIISENGLTYILSFRNKRAEK